MYFYTEEKPKIFTEDGQVKFLKVRDKSKKLIELAGCARLQEIISGVGGDSFFLIACVDRLVEIGELREIKQNGVVGQNRIFVSCT